MEATKVLIPASFVDAEKGLYEVTGTGKIQIRNTGGASSSEGGMGSGSDDDQSKGDLTKSGDRSGNAASSGKDDDTFDPIGKNIKEKEKENESGKG
jgi:hypothetical protein